MMTSSKVSVLIPVYNRANIILETLKSAVNQTYKNIEVIVVDNKSIDNTYGIVKRFAKLHPNVRAYQNEENIGPVRNWRKCLDYATGEYVKILWSDDLIAPTFIEKTLPYLTDNKDVGFVFTGTEIFNAETGQRIKAYFIGNTGIYDTKKFIEGSLLGGPFPVSPGNALFRKKDVEKNLIIDIPNKIGSNFKMHAIGNDLLIFLLTAKDYSKFAFVKETLSYFRSHPDSITISSSPGGVALSYALAKAFFVENYIFYNKLIKKFNARLFLLLFKLKKRTKSLGLREVKDFYFNENKAEINYFFIPKLLLRRALSIHSK